MLLTVGITVLLFLDFTKEPSDSIVVDGTVHQINCSATSSLPFNIVLLWKQNGTWITDFRDKSFRQLPDGALMFLPVKSQDQGFYQCSAIAYDNAGQKRDQVLSKIATLRLACRFALHWGR